MHFSIRRSLAIYSFIFPLIFLSLVRGLVEENLALSSSSSKSAPLVDSGGEMETTDGESGLINSLITWITTTSLLSNSRFLFSDDDGQENVGFGGSKLSNSDRRTQALVWSAFASIMVALTGVVPAIFLGTHGNSKRTTERTLNRLLSFAVGSLLGDVFLHILPETWRYTADGSDYGRHCGMWVIFGSVVCFLVEKCASSAEDSRHKAAAFVNLFANAIDNFTHGLAVGASFSVSVKFGMLTTFAILIHEIPHEISDFAILLRADFDRWSAVKAQLMTATGGVLGASVALISDNGALGLERRAACWILPFTAGGFLNVALVQVLPDLLKEKSAGESAMQFVYILTGVALMGLISAMHV